MQPAAQTTTHPSPARLLVSRILFGLTVAFLLFDSISKVAKVSMAVDGSIELGYPESTVMPIGVILLICTALYAIPRTAVFGAVLLTGYLGGAVATHVRVENPLLGYTLFPIYVAVLLWGALCLRDRRLLGVLFHRAR